MINASRSIIINAPVNDVFPFLTQGENNKKWRNDVLKISLVSGKSDAVGATYKQVLSGPFGQKIAGDYKVTEYKKNDTLGFEIIAGPARPKGVYKVEQIKEGTKLSFALSLE